MAKSEYFRDRHLVAVTQAAQRAGIKGAAFSVLSYLCSASAFTKPTVCVSKAKISERTGYSEKTVKAALASLRAVGSIDAIACLEGGRHRATIYKLMAKAGKGGENFPPNEETGQKGGSFFPKGGKFFPERGEETSPPSISSSISSSRDERRGAGRTAAPPNNGGFAPAETFGQRIVEAMRLHRCGYGEAREIVQREARADGGELR